MTIEEILKKLKIKKGDYKDLHITRMFSSFVAVSDGKIIGLTDPHMKHCPLFKMIYTLSPNPENLEALKANIKKAVEEKISKFGSFTKLRGLHREDIAVPFGASEMIMYGINKKEIDAAVIVCDGAGSVIADNPSLIQGIGARMNGLFYTTPIKEIINGIEKNGGLVVDPETATIHQIAGIKKATSLGYKNIAVTINGFTNDDISQVEKLEKKYNVTIYSIIVCTTGVSIDRTKHIIKHSDLVWSCASGTVRELVGKNSILQLSNAIPVFILTKKGLGFLAGYSQCKDFLKGIDEKKQYLAFSNGKGGKLTLGTFTMFLEVKALPVSCKHEPY